MAVEMYGDDADSSGRNLSSGIFKIDGTGVVHVDENGHGAREADGLDGRERSVRGHENLVAVLDAEGRESHPDGGGGAAGEHGVLAAEVTGELLLEGGAFRPEDVVARVDGGQHRDLDLVNHRLPRKPER